MHRVLIITYYWPPSGGSGVLRWLKFAKYLRGFGWEPVIYTPANPEPQEIDKSLLGDVPLNLEVITSKIWEPYNIYKWLTGKKKEDHLGVAMMSENKKGGLISTLSLWIRSNLFIPDPRMLWIMPSIRYLSNYLDKNPVDIIITTGPPHSMHLIGLGLKRKLGIKWVADFRDPWTNIDFYKDLMLSGIADRHHRKLEMKVLKGASHILTVSPGMTEEYKSMGAKAVTTITNGYDEEPVPTEDQDIHKFVILHLGSMPKSRNPENLWLVLGDLVKHHNAFASALEIMLVGKADHLVHESIVRYQLEDFVVQEGFVPHSMTMGLLKSSAVLLLCVNNTPNANGILTNKFFEYLLARRPILAIGPKEGDVAKILRDTGAGKIFSFDDTDLLKDHLMALFELYSHGNLLIDSSGFEKYSRKNLTGQLSVLLNNLTH